MTTKPQYGEFATPEQQAAAKGVPYLPPPVEGTAVPVAPPSSGFPPPQAGQIDVSPPIPKSRKWDSIVTTILIVLWSYSVFASLGDYANLGETMSRGLESFGMGEFSFALASQVGIVMNAVQVGLLAVTLVLVFRATRAGKLTWYIPLVTAVISFIAIVVLMSVVMFNDPAFMNWIETQR